MQVILPPLSNAARCFVEEVYIPDYRVVHGEIKLLPMTDEHKQEAAREPIPQFGFRPPRKPQPAAPPIDDTWIDN